MESDYVEVQYSLQGGMNLCNKFEWHIFAAKEVMTVDAHYVHVQNTIIAIACRQCSPFRKVTVNYTIYTRY